MHTRHTVPLANRPPLELGPQALVMGILNVTPDSFSDGGHHNMIEAALDHARQMVAEGADIIDIGGESTRPGAQAVGVQEELDRVIPVIDALVRGGIEVPISIDTYKPLVADQALQAGAAIVNDVHGLQGDPHMAQVVALHDAAIIAMHWDKAVTASTDIFQVLPPWFETSIALAQAAGISADRIILDPGFGFGKNLQQNFGILSRLDVLIDDSFPVVVGISRKSMLGNILHNEPHERLAGTIATTVLGYCNGGHIFRVHDVKANLDALRIAQATLYGPSEHLL